jgi:hypothetical protein
VSFGLEFPTVARGRHPDPHRDPTVIKMTSPTKKPTRSRLFVSCGRQEKLVPEKGVEPSTFSLRMSCSTN